MTPGFFRAILLSLLVAVPWSGADAVVRYDFEQPIFTELPGPVMDHCIVEDNGLYHLFYLRGNPAVNIGHATTTDFVHWNMQPPILAPGTWDDKALWAPQIVRHPTLNWWYMYYTGVNAANAQQTGLAFSENLSMWFKYADPVYRPDPSWAEWSITNFSHGRDPHIVEKGGRYYMFVTAKTKNNRGAVAGAVSDDLINWQDIGPIYVHTSWRVLESVFIFKQNNRYHMFFTEETVGGTSAMVSDSLLSGWDITTRRIIDGGHAPQVTDTHLGQMFSRHAVYNNGQGTYQHIIRFTPMAWLGQIPAVPKPMPLAGSWTFVSGDAFYYQPTFKNNAAVRNENYPSSFKGDGWINTFEYYTGPLGYGAPGAALGDAVTGVIRSATFTVEGNSMSLLVGGGDFPTQCYVRLVDAGTGQVLFSETGRNTNVMDRRVWDIRPHQGRNAYIEIADLSTASFGHICVDDIIESYEVPNGDTGGNGGGGSGQTKTRPGGGASPVQEMAQAGSPRLHANVPNPFNPATTIVFDLPGTAAVRVEIFDASGGRVRTLVNENRSPGTHRETWHGTDENGDIVPSGVYFYRLMVNGTVVDTRKMVLLK